MSLKNIYKSRLVASVYVTRNGKPLHFIDGKHITDNQEDIAELEMEIKRGSQEFSIYVDPAESQVDTSLQDAIAQATREAALKVIADFEAAKLAASSKSDQTAMVPAQQASLTPAKLLNVTSSADLANLSAPSGT
jgi:molecular chaperone GrpE (heat shock protein)